MISNRWLVLLIFGLTFSLAFTDNDHSEDEHDDDDAGEDGDHDDDSGDDEEEDDHKGEDTGDDEAAPDADEDTSEGDEPEDDDGAHLEHDAFLGETLVGCLGARGAERFAPSTIFVVRRENRTGCFTRRT